VKLVSLTCLSATPSDLPIAAAVGKYRRAFTLIELLVVMVILAVLAALLLQALARGRERSKSMQCLNRLKQAGDGLQLYAADHHGQIPRGNRPYWWEAVATQSNRGRSNTTDAAVALFRCPSYPNQNQLVSYVVNAWDFVSPTDMTGFQATGTSMLSEFQRPAETLFLVDNESGAWRPIVTEITSNLFHDVWRPDHLAYRANGKLLSPARRIAANRHSNGANLLQLDGHVTRKDSREITEDDFRAHKR